MRNVPLVDTRGRRIDVNDDSTTAASVCLAPSGSPSAPWDPFLSTLALGENAGAQQFAIIAEGFQADGHSDVAATYLTMAEEEQAHYTKVCSTFGEFMEPSAQIARAFPAAVVGSNISLVERMAVAHIAYENAAMGFLGHLHARIENHTNDTAWVRTLRAMCERLLRDEVSHLKNGNTFLAKFLPRQDAQVLSEVDAAVRLHRALIIRMTRQAFRGAPEHRALVDGMIAAFNQRYERSRHDILQPYL